jgi:adenosylhomocysteine nucleosidase
MIGQVEVVVAHTGIGPKAAAVAIAPLLPIAPWSHLIAAGFAGGLDPQLRLADTLVESRPSSEPHRLISRPLPVESVEEKARVFRETGAAAVDMETDTIAAACAAANIPFTAIRAISDPAETALPVSFAAWFDLKKQRPRPLGLLAHLVRHPGRIPPFIRFLRNLSRAAENLATAVENKITHFHSQNEP